jgi:hypothetical protein
VLGRAVTVQTGHGRPFLGRSTLGKLSGWPGLGSSRITARDLDLVIGAVISPVSSLPDAVGVWSSHSFPFRPSGHGRPAAGFGETAERPLGAHAHVVILIRVLGLVLGVVILLLGILLSPVFLLLAPLALLVYLVWKFFRVRRSVSRGLKQEQKRGRRFRKRLGKSTKQLKKMK